jgi:xylulokinase
VRTLVAGVDSSTQSCKVVVRDALTGELVREGRAPHPDGTEVDPQAWYDALTVAISVAGGLADVSAIAIGGQQHGLLLLDDEGSTVRDALLWNDNRSAPQAAAMVNELGAQFWADAVGSVPVASFTISKLRWVAEHEPDNAARAAAVCLPHDWLTWRLAGGGDPSGSSPVLTTDRGDASGTGYWSPLTGEYRTDLLTAALGHLPTVPVVIAPAASAGATRLRGRLADLVPDGIRLAAGTGDNMAAALGLSIIPGDVVVSIGTSGTVFAIATQACADPAGEIAGFADATGRFLPLVCTLNAARVLTGGAHLLGVDFGEFDRLALSAEPGAGGLVLLPYLEGERTPLRPDATGVLAGLTGSNMTPANLARATVEGMLCGLADAVDALIASGVQVDRILLIGGGAQSEAVRQIAPRLFGRSVLVPAPGEYVAEGAARQASWAATGQLPVWAPPAAPARYEADPTLFVRDAYAQLRG